METLQMHVDATVAQDMLQRYSADIVGEMTIVRDEIRRGQWEIDRSLHEEYDSLCFCLAVWELTHEMVVSTAPSAVRLLHWHNRHYLEEDVAEWWQQAQQHASAPKAAGVTGEQFWDPLCRLALSDYNVEVLQLLEHSAEGVDAHVGEVCDFLRKIPSLQQMDRGGASSVEFQQATHEIQEMASAMLQAVPPKHQVRQLLEVYAGCSQDRFDAGRDVGKCFGRTWIEDIVYAHAWVFPDMRRTELGELLRSVAGRRMSENITEIDHVLFAVLSLNIPELLQLLASMPERFPPFFLTHLVDILYFAGRVPTFVEVDDVQLVPPRDWHLMAYAQDLSNGPRIHMRYALDYLRAGGSQAAVKALALTADQYCAGAGSDADMEEALATLADLNLLADSGVRHCRRRAQALRFSGDVMGSLRWACRAERCGSFAFGYFVSELLDNLADEDLNALLEALTPSDLSESLEAYPPQSLLAGLIQASGEDMDPRDLLPPSGRLYFYSVYARCRSMRLAGLAACSYAPALVQLLAAGVAPPKFAEKLLREELLPAVADEEPPLNVQDALLLIQYVQRVSSDPLRRTSLGIRSEDLHQSLGRCLSQAVLRGGTAASRLSEQGKKHGLSTTSMLQMA